MKTALVMSVILAILVVIVMLVLTFVERIDPAVGSMKTALVMSVILAVLVVIVMLVLTFVERIDPERDQTKKMYYFTSNDIHVNWSVARGECGRLVPGALLATIESQEESECFLQTVPKGYPANVERERLYWLDGTKQLKHGGWVWGSTRQPVEEFLQWQSSSPASDGDQQCLAVLVHSDPDNVTWTALRCDTDVVGFVCQYYDLA